MCFVAGTGVLAACGTVAIEDIKAGDYVWATNPETGETALKQVVQTFVNETTEFVHITVNGEEIVCTSEHPFYSPFNGWLAANELKVGGALLTASGEVFFVEQVTYELLDDPIKVYNFEVDDYHTYFVGESCVLVHNMCAKKSIDVSPKEFISKPRNAKQLVGYLEDNGFKAISQRDSHVKMVKDTYTTIVPNHGSKEIAKGTLSSIMKQVGLM